MIGRVVEWVGVGSGSWSKVLQLLYLRPPTLANIVPPLDTMNSMKVREDSTFTDLGFGKFVLSKCQPPLAVEDISEIVVIPPLQLLPLIEE